MIRIHAVVGLAVLIAVALPAARPVARAGWSGRVAPNRSVEKTIASWPMPAKASARATMAKYGRPDEIGDDALVWYNNGPWKKTIAHRLAWPHYALMVDKDYLENTIGYAAPDDMLDALSRFDNKLDADRVSAELSSRSESEAMNFLSLNLADEIVRGKRTVNEAREVYAKTVRLAAAGKSSPYLLGLRFEVHNDATPNTWSW